MRVSPARWSWGADAEEGEGGERCSVTRRRCGEAEAGWRGLLDPASARVGEDSDCIKAPGMTSAVREEM